jgi:hypothetical protein
MNRNLPHAEIQSLREQTDKQVSAEVEVLKVAQKEALDAVKAMTQETQIVCFPLTHIRASDRTTLLGMHQSSQQPQEKEG